MLSFPESGPDAPSIYVSSLHEMPEHVARLRPSYLVSLVNPEEMPPTPGGVAAERHLRVGVHDISDPLEGCIHPAVEHLEEVVDFLRRWEPQAGPVLIHCYAGVSRSMATALIGLVVKAPGREAEAASALRAAAPHAQPNRRMVALADEILGCGGRLVAAREAMGFAPAIQRGPLVALTLLR
jgi:predicted protein tyrosine phosphatase